MLYVLLKILSLNLQILQYYCYKHIVNTLTRCIQMTALLECICDQACENRAYLHTKFGLIFELQLTISFEVQAL